MHKEELEPLFRSYVEIVKFQRIRAVYPAPAMHVSSVKTGIWIGCTAFGMPLKRLTA